MIAGGGVGRRRAASASSTARGAASASPTPMTSPWCATRSPSWSGSGLRPEGPVGGGLLSPGATPGAPGPVPLASALLPRPRSSRPRVDGRRAPARPRVESVDATLHAQGYRLEVEADGVRLVGADDAGLRHGRATLAQLARHRAPSGGSAVRDAAAGDGGADTLPVCRIEDWPDFAVRGVMLDVAAGPGPHPRHRAVASSTGWRAGRSISCSSTWSTPSPTAGHEEVWRDAGPYTAARPGRARRLLPGPRRGARGQPEHAGALRALAAPRPVSAPRHRPRRLRHGCSASTDPRSPSTPPSPGRSRSCPTSSTSWCPRSPAGASTSGMDEPWELPAERRAEWGQWLDRLRALPVLADRELLVWGDIPAMHPDLLAGIPSEVAVCEWGYEDNHPFDERCAAPRRRRACRSGCARAPRAGCRSGAGSTT